MRRIASTLVMSCLLAAQANAQQAPFDAKVREDYANDFFRGFTHPGDGIATGSAMKQTAYLRGQAYWRDHPSERGKVFAEHGYVAVEREGYWSRGFERNAFEPADGDEDSWWMTLLDGASRSTTLDRWSARSHVRVVGYVSPKGHYGHLGGYEQEVLVTSVVLVESGNQIRN